MAETQQTGRPGRPKKRRKPRPGDPVPMPRWMFYPLTVGTIAASFMLFRRGDPVTAVTVGVIAFSGWTGFRMGLGRITATVLALAGATMFAPPMGMNYENRFSEQFGTTGLTNRFLCIASIGVLISLVVTIVVTMISNRFLVKRTKLNLANSFIGFAIGLAEGAVLALLVLGGLLSLQMWQRGDETPKNRVAKAVDEWASRTRQSAIGHLVRDYNPFERIELLAGAGEFRQGVQRMKDPSNIKRLLDNPKIAALRSDPAVSEALDELRNDQSIKELVEQRQPLDRQMMMRLMSSPSVMRLVDHPEFLERARQAIAELE